jgi:hypothetical protein
VETFLRHTSLIQFNRQALEATGEARDAPWRSSEGLAATPSRCGGGCG